MIVANAYRCNHLEIHYHPYGIVDKKYYYCRLNNEYIPEWKCSKCKQAERHIYTPQTKINKWYK